MNICLENQYIKVEVKPQGAELISLINRKTSTEHIWNADPAYWAKSSPVLFPIVGGLKDGAYTHQGKRYELPRHGFARDNMFDLESHSESKAVFSFKSNGETLKVYPFNFELKLIYSLNKNKLTVAYELYNEGTELMLFSLGAHPAFAVPFRVEETYDDYSLKFEKDDAVNQWPLTVEGLIESEAFKVKLQDKEMPLSKELFHKDALVYKDLKSEQITLHSKRSMSFLKFKFKSFPFFGIWAAKDANFVCLEPWCGIADSVNHNQELSEKEGINKLEAGKVFKRAWSVEVYS